MEDKCYRNELKQVISIDTKKMLSRRLGSILKMDPNYKESSYKVRSLYFDNLHNDALIAKLDGIPNREKFRIRCYNDDFQFIKLEKKVKEFNKGYKLSTLINIEETEKIINSDIDFMKNGSDNLLREFYIKIRTKGLRPTTIIEYERQAFIYAPGNTRVTLDYNIGCSMNKTGFFDLKLPMIEPEKGRCVLEVKFDSFLSDLIKTLIASDSGILSANSKYASGRLCCGI